MSDAKPVLPASVLPAPAAALDPIATPSTGFDKLLSQANVLVGKAVETTKPYLDKTLETTKPYTDAVAAKTKEVISDIQGSTSQASAQTSTATTNLEKSASATTDAAVAEGQADAAGAKSFLSKGLEQAQATFTQVTQVIEQKTTTDKHPGLISQLTSASHKVMDKADELFNGPAGTTTASVTTTTNTVPHPVVGP